jgi:hypothetical protein
VTRCWRALPALLLLVPASLAAAPDPLAAYYGNTLVSLGSAGQDLSHLWLEPDGSFILFGGAQAARAGRISVAAPLADGSVPVCLSAQSAGIAIPPEVAATAAPPDRFATARCVDLASHSPGDRWADPAVPGFHFLLVPGQR